MSRPGTRGLGWRLFGTGLLAAYAFAAWGSGFDRMSAAAPALERLVPVPLRAQADRSAAAVALARNESARALALAERAVRADPLDPMADSLLGAARQLSGDPAGAEDAFRVSAQRGWRDRLTQLYWYDAAIQAGDYARAALRADAILRADPGFAAAPSLLGPLEASEAGRAELARRLDEKPAWATDYFGIEASADAQQLRRRAQVAQLAGATSPLGCHLPRPLVGLLLARGMRRDAEALWRIHCPAESLEGGLADGGFERLADESVVSPFGWYRFTRGDVGVELVEQPGGGHAVRASNAASVTRVLLSQAVGLEPGRYRVSATIAPAAEAGRVVVSLECGGGLRRPDGVEGNLAQGGQVVRIGDCDSQMLGVWLRPGSGEVTIDDLAIERID